MTPTHEESPAHHSGHDQGRHGGFRYVAITAAKIFGVIFALAALVHISWNMFAPDMFGLDAIRMKQALGLVVFTLIIAGVFRFAGSRHAWRE